MMPEHQASSKRWGSRDLVHQHGVLGSLARFWQKSYGPDYIGLLLILAGYLVLQFFAEPFHRMFTLDDPTIQFPHAIVERVPLGWLFGFAAGVPLVVIGLWAAIFRPTGHHIHVTLLALTISLILTSFLTDIFKNAVGRPRPDLLDRCKPVRSIPSVLLRIYRGSADEVCTETNHHILHDGWRSFPSGHSSSAFSGLGFLAIFLSGQMHVLRSGAQLTSILLVLVPLVGASMIAISRCEDYRHDVYDVTVGSLLGLVVAHLSYRRYYPALRSPHCHTPYPSPAELAMIKDLRDSSDDYGTIPTRSLSGDGGGRIEESLPLREVSIDTDRDLERGHG